MKIVRYRNSGRDRGVMIAEEISLPVKGQLMSFYHDSFPAIPIETDIDVEDAFMALCRQAEDTFDTPSFENDWLFRAYFDGIREGVVQEFNRKMASC